MFKYLIMASQFKKVIPGYNNEEHIINFDNYTNTPKSLDDFIYKLKGIKTVGKWDTWSRTYIEVPLEVLFEFGIISNLPLVSYVNFIYNKQFNYCYPGEIFTGDAAWFDEYQELNENEIKSSLSYKKLKEVLENTDKSKTFFDFYNRSKEKWSIVPIHNEDIAEIAAKLNKHLK